MRVVKRFGQFSDLDQVAGFIDLFLTNPGRVLEEIHPIVLWDVNNIQPKQWQIVHRHPFYEVVLDYELRPIEKPFDYKELAAGIAERLYAIDQANKHETQYGVYLDTEGGIEALAKVLGEVERKF